MRHPESFDYADIVRLDYIRTRINSFEEPETDILLDDIRWLIDHIESMDDLLIDHNNRIQDMEFSAKDIDELKDAILEVLGNYP